MDLTNLNDTAGIQALLEKLRSSQVWQDTINSGHNDVTSLPQRSTEATLGQASHPDPDLETAEGTQASQAHEDPPIAPSPGPSVASLLSQLHAPLNPDHDTWDLHSTLYQPATQNVAHARDAVSYNAGPTIPIVDLTTSSVSEPSPPVRADQSLRALTFQQSLPHFVRLSEDPAFVSAIKSMKEEQARLERQLWEERRTIQKSHEEKVKVERTKAQLTGGGISQYQANMMSDAFRRELQKFDAERVLPAWDGLLKKQQTALEALGVPGMYPTSERSDREKQQRIVQVLAGVAD
ncbi:hypothetical protein C8Q75DRAFT_273742 [Abortiporus biennis]|nr:hypothetical protein C8Q75DRAFT_273742 [Abortiporus biennis]